MDELINKWEVVSKPITLQNNYNFFKNEWDAERLYREIAKLEIDIGKTPGLEVVRCKDCRKCSVYDDVITGQKQYICRLWHGATREVDEDSFCSAGERKDNDNQQKT